MKNSKLISKYHGNFCSVIGSAGVISMCCSRPVLFLVSSYVKKKKKQCVRVTCTLDIRGIRQDTSANGLICDVAHRL